MHHIVLERWSRGGSALHRLDPRAKIIPLLAMLVALATCRRGLPEYSLLIFAMLCGALAVGRIPVWPAVTRAALVLPFSAAFAAVCCLSGDPARGAALALKSYLSALGVLTVVATTPLTALLGGLERLGAPLFFLNVVQFLYRYLFVISEEAQHMRKAAASRGTPERRFQSGGARFQAAAGALAVLFARSYSRAQDVHRAMLARGFTGRLQPLFDLRFRRADAAFVALASLAPVAARVAVESFR